MATKKRGRPSSQKKAQAVNKATRQLHSVIWFAVAIFLMFVVFIPGENEVQPYTVFISPINLNVNLVYEYTVSISQQGEEYYAELLEVITREVIMK